jgi:hypothetical protein
MACFADAVFSIRLFDGDWNWASAEVRVSFPYLLAEAPAYQFATESPRPTKLAPQGCQ